MIEHKHDYEIHYADVSWQDPIFIKCPGCGSTFFTTRKPEVATSERLADAAETILFHEYTIEDLEEMKNAWQAHVDEADEDTTAPAGD